RLSLSHHRALLPIRNASLKRELADAALIGGWSSHRLEEEGRAHLGGCRVGRKPIDGVVRSVRQLRRSLFEVQCAASSPGALSELPYGELADLREAIQVCRNALADLVTALEDDDCFRVEIG